MWFALSLTATGDVSHSSRCGNVSGWRLISPLANHCLRRARLSSMRLAQIRKSELGTTDFTDLLSDLNPLRDHEATSGLGRFFHSVARSGYRHFGQCSLAPR